MQTRYFATIIFAVLLACGAAFAATEAEDAQMEALAAAMAMMADEPSMTQTDVDAFIAMAPQVEEVMNDENAILKLYTDNNISPQCFGLISMKIAYGLMMTQGISREDFLATGEIPEFFLPNDDEVALIEANLEALMEAME